MVQSYIRRRATAGTNGRQMNVNIQTIRRVKGTTPNQLNLPGLAAENQQAIPIRGQRDTYEVLIRIKTETANVAFDVDTAEATSAHSPTALSISAQYNFLYDELISNDISSSYQLYLEAFDITFIGSLLINDQPIDSENFGQELFITLTMNRGKNFIFTALTS